MTATEARQPAAGGPQLWPLSVRACRTLGELGLLPKTRNGFMAGLPENLKVPFPQWPGVAPPSPAASGPARRLAHPPGAADHLPGFRAGAGLGRRPGTRGELLAGASPHGGVGRRSLRDQPRLRPHQAPRPRPGRRAGSLVWPRDGGADRGLSPARVSGEFTERAAHGPGRRFGGGYFSNWKKSSEWSE